MLTTPVEPIVVVAVAPKYAVPVTERSVVEAPPERVESPETAREESVPMEVSEERVVTEGMT